jgi:outer membrane receptor protein involved in Fe transport
MMQCAHVLFLARERFGAVSFLVGLSQEGALAVTGSRASTRNRNTTEEEFTMQLKSSLRLAVLASFALGGAAMAQTPPANQGQTPTPPPAEAVPPAALPSPDDTGRKNATEEIVVTGSRVRRKDLTTPAPVTVISKEQITASGIASIGDFLQQMPEQGGATNTNVNNGGDGQTQISLRNLGAQRTLVLVDGKRWVNGGSGAGTTTAAVDLNSIPAAAIERIEVLKDGASALYGSDAIGGVVNIITRRRVNGVELTGYGGMSPHGDAEQYNASVTGGAVSDKGSFMFTAEYFDQRAMLAGNRDWAKNALSHDYSTGQTATGGSGTIPNGRVRVDPSTCTTQLCTDLANAFGAGTRYFTPDASKPACAAGPAPRDGSCSVDGWRPFLSAAAAARLGVKNDLYNYQSVNFLITPSTRKSLFANGEYHVSDSARAYFQGSFLNRASSNLLAPEPLTTSAFGIVTSGLNPYNPFKIDIIDARRRLVEYAGRSQSFDLDTVRTVAGIDGTLPSEFGPLQGVYWDLAFNYGRTSGTTSNYGSLNVQSVGNGLTGPFFTDPSLITPTNPKGYGCGASLATALPNCVPVNLFGGKGTLTPDMVTALGGYRGIQTGWNQIAAFTANVSSELFKVAAERPVGIAAGYEYRNVYGGFLPDPIGAAGLSFDYNSQETRGSYHVNEGYAELDIPVVSNLPFADDVEVQAAARVFSYSTFGSDATYKFGARWRPIRDITIRGTYSTGFRAPDVSDLYGGIGPSAEVAVDPCANAVLGTATGNRCAQFAASQGSTVARVVGNGDSSTQLNSTVGGNVNLQPEKADIATVGVVFEPTLPILRGFTATVDYYNIKVKQDLGFITTPVILRGCYLGTYDAFCALVHRDPATGFISNVIDLETNVGSIQTSGIDFAARYSIPTDFGRFALLFDSTYLIYIRQTLGNGEVISAAGNYDFGSGSAISNVTPKLKFNAGVNYTLAGFNLGVRGRYIGGYDECAGSDGGSLSSGLCSLRSPPVDANGDPIPGGTPYGPHRVPSTTLFDVYASYLIKTPFGSTTLSAGIRNLFDTTPPTVYNAFLTYTDPAYDLVGRFVYGRVSHAF